MPATVYRSVVAETWLYSTLTGLSSVNATFGERLVVVDVEDPSGVTPPFLTIVRHPSIGVVRPLGSAPVAESFLYDIAGYDAGYTTNTILAAMNDIDAAMLTDDDVIQDGYQIVVSDEGELPSLPPPRLGDDPYVRLGKTYRILIMD